MLEKFKNPKIIRFLSIALILSASLGIFLYSKKQKNEIISEIYFGEALQEAKTEEDNNISKEKIIIHIDGAIMNPGVYEIEKESRIDDAINIAGGLTSEADLEEINLAYKITDGVKINIPSRVEQDNIAKSIVKKSTSNPTKKKVIESSSGGIVKEEKTTDTSTLNVNINTASIAQLDTLTGIGPATAQKIIDYRNQKGSFSSKEELKSVNGIGEAKYNKIKDLIEI